MLLLVQDQCYGKPTKIRALHRGLVGQRAMNFIASLFAFYCKSAKEGIYTNIFISYRLDGFQLDERTVDEKGLFTT